MKMHRMIAAAIEWQSRPPGHSQDSCGLIACAPAVPANTRTSAMMLTTINTPNWMAISTFCIRSDTTMPRALTSVIATMKNDPSSHLGQEVLGQFSRPRNLNR